MPAAMGPDHGNESAAASPCPERIGARPTIESALGALEHRSREDAGGRLPPLRDWVALAESWLIRQALREAGGNRAAAARALGIGRRTLYTKMAKLGIA
jgi:DNA-binding NtrC family response regulator